MTFAELQNEVIQIRFKESQRASVKSWLNLRYQFVWGMADWPWKRVGPTFLILTTGDRTPTPPLDFDRPLHIYDDSGNELTYLSPDDFDREYLSAEIAQRTGKPEAYKWVRGVITVGPAPDINYNYNIVYERAFGRTLDSGVFQAGPMSADNDVPTWDAGFHYVLVPGAISLGLRMENDPTFGPVEEEFQTLVRSMQDYYLPTLAPVGNLQFGADEF